MQAKKAKTKVKQYVNDNPIEAIRNIGQGVLGSFGSDLGLGMLQTSRDQIIGTSEHSSEFQGGDLAEGQELDLTAKSKREEKEKYMDVDPGIDYRREILHAEKKIAQEDQQQLNSKIEQIIVELKRLASSSKILEVQFRQVTVEQRIVHPGKYHVSFFEWVLAIVKTARIRVEDSGSWMALFKSKKAQRQYWNMFKKHGTTFGLSNERVVATQTG